MTPLAFLVAVRQTDLVNTLDQLAQVRDVAGLTRYLENPNAKTANDRNPFQVLQTGGGYAAGEMGWHARLLEPKGSQVKYVVFSTPILVEDLGELLFRVEADGKLTYIPERDDLGMVLRSHDFDVSFDLPGHGVRVTDSFTCRSSGSAGPYFLFRMSPTLKVTSVTHSGRPVPFVQAGGITAVTTGREGVFTVTYAGTLEKPGFARQIGPDEATLSGSMWYPMIARHPSTYKIAIHGPANWLALAQGREISSSVQGSERVTRYQMDMPVVWISATTGPYRRVTDRIDGIDFSTISAAATEVAMHRQNHFNAEVIAFYSKTFAPYPFKSWTTVDSTQFRQGVGALEAYSFATYPAGGVPFQDTHEPGHTWWGGMINNDYLASIWNESFTDYSQQIYNLDQPYGNRVERHNAFSTQGGYDPSVEAAPLAQSGQDIGPPATSLGYVKGAYVLQVLEDELGADLFLKCLREWLRSNPVAHVGSWEDFEAVVNRVSGQDYRWFFDEWVQGVGLPDWILAEGMWNNGVFTGRVKFYGRPYRMHTDAVVEYPDGGRLETRVLIDPAKDGQFMIACPRQPKVVALDAYGKIASHRRPGGNPASIARFDRTTLALDAAHPDYLKPLTGTATPSAPPADLAGVFLVGSPETVPAMADLCRKAGLEVKGDRLTYDHTTVDLKSGGALAIVDLPGGKKCLIGLGTCARRPELGRARLVVFDGEGHMLRAKTDPFDDGPRAIKPGP